MKRREGTPGSFPDELAVLGSEGHDSDFITSYSQDSKSGTFNIQVLHMNIWGEQPENIEKPTSEQTPLQ